MYFMHEKLNMETYPGAHFKWSNPIEKEIEKQSFGGESCVIDYKLNNRIPTAGKNKVVLDWSDNNEVNSNEYLAVFKKSLCSIEMHDGYVKKNHYNYQTMFFQSWKFACLNTSCLSQ